MSETSVIAIKAAGDEWQLDVLGVPFGGVDSDGEYFTKRTAIHADRFTDPLILYYHSYDENGRPQGNPETIGKAISIELREDGWWYRVALDKTKSYAQRIWQAAKDGLAAASSGSISHVARMFKGDHLVPYRKGMGGEIGVWPVVELSLIDIGEGRAPANRYAVALPVMKMRYEQAGIVLPDDIDGESDGSSEDGDIGDASAAAQRSKSAVKADEPTETDQSSPSEEYTMDKQEMAQVAADAVAAALKARDDQEAEDAQRAAELETAKKEAAEDAAKAVAETMQKEIDSLKAEVAAGRRLPGGYDGAPAMTQFDNVAKFDDLDATDLSVLAGILDGAAKGNKGSGVSEDLRRALAIRIADSDETKSDDWVASKRALSSALKGQVAFKANELNQSTLSSYGDEWVGVTYSTQLWDKIRLATPIVGMIPTVTVPQGSESVTIPTASTSPTFYKVAQASAQGSNPGAITSTVTTSKMGTANQSLSVAKLGAAAIYAGEMDEDSLIPWVSELRRDLTNEAAEVLEHIVIDGDTETGATTNINDIGGTPAGTEAFMIANGFRKLALVTNTANSRSGTTLAIGDFLDTIKLMGLGGANAFDRSKVAFITDMHTYWKSLDLAEMKSVDYGNQTVAGQAAITPWGYTMYGSPNMHRANQDATYGLKANSAGKVDLDTASNNTTGSILSVRWDQWRFGYKRRMTFEIDRVPLADATAVVVMMRVGLVYRDTEASAISYNITV